MISPLILLLATHLSCGDRPARGGGPRQPPRLPVIHYTPFAANRSCQQNATRNATVADNGLFTLNFVDEDAVKVFQLPRCLFDTQVAREIFASVDLTETAESYRRRFRDFFVVPLYGAFRLAVAAPDADRRCANPGLSPPPEGAIKVKDFPIELRTIHHIPRTKICAVADHPAMFNLRVRCSHHRLRWASYEATISLTPRFFVLTINPDGYPSTRTLAAFFGDVREIDLKAPYSPTAFLLRQTEAHDLLLVVREKAATTTFGFLTDRDLLNDTFSVEYTDLTICLRVLSLLASRLLRMGLCGKIERPAFEFLLTYGTCLFLGNSVTYHADVDVGVPLWRQSELELIGDFARRCFGASSADGNPTPPFRSRAALRTPPPENDFYDNGRATADVLSRALSAYARTLHASTLADLAYLFRAPPASPGPTPVSLLPQLLPTAEAYYTHSLTAPLPRTTRRVLIRIDGAIRSHLNASEAARTLFAILASMCSPRELLTWTDILHDARIGGPSDAYSPCLSGARKDYTEQSIQELLRTARRSEGRAALVMLASERLRPAHRELSHEGSCAPESVPTATITTEDRTYVISTRYILKGLVFPIGNTVIGKNLLITALERRSPCVYSTSYRSHSSITVLKNITFTEHCEFCGSVLMEYDEVGGINSLIYIPTLADLKQITEPKNDILVATSRTHYLLLTKNGTVFEVTDILVDIKSMSYPVVILVVLVGLLGLFGLYKVCSRRKYK
ncbi:pR75 [rat cytomegalovirus strain Maastricht]|uniref:PR75 n=1 Tax=Rat cytomegalovirus (strain Maastricht) TaxID=79700 RepID=Q9DWC5_RCMVM|nr:pR75 [rat cytomegalovirus strain Maastricht]AAF99165.1 pR75 [rat cytomegalovirus strain Maastricht]WEG71996.1 envelope glycoprotein H [Murid betaherpesvirus 2]